MIIFFFLLDLELFFGISPDLKMLTLVAGLKILSGNFLRQVLSCSQVGFLRILELSLVISSPCLELFSGSFL